MLRRRESLDEYVRDFTFIETGWEVCLQRVDELVTMKSIRVEDVVGKA